MKNEKPSKLELDLERIWIIEELADSGICGEFQGKVYNCPMYAVDCPQICTHAKEKKIEREWNKYFGG